MEPQTQTTSISIHLPAVESRAVAEVLSARLTETPRNTLFNYTREFTQTSLMVSKTMTVQYANDENTLKRGLD